LGDEALLHFLRENYESCAPAADVDGKPVSRGNIVSPFRRACLCDETQLFMALPVRLQSFAKFMQTAALCFEDKMLYCGQVVGRRSESNAGDAG